MTILNDIKLLLGLTAAYGPFDAQILMYINTALLSISQIGVEGGRNLEVDDKTEWGALYPNNAEADLKALKSLIYYKVWLAFDPPASSSLASSVENMIKELEFRVYVEVDPPLVEVPSDEV